MAVWNDAAVSDYGKRLAALRMDRGLGPFQAAKLIGIQHETLKDAEEGRSLPQQRTRQKIGRFYGVHPETLQPASEPEVTFPGGRRHRADAVAIAGDQRILISLKWQQVGGTAEQKVPFEVMCLADAVRGGAASRAYLVLGGDGWTLRDYFTSGALALEHLAHDVQRGADAATIARRLGEVRESILYIVDRAEERGTRCWRHRTSVPRSFCSATRPAARRRGIPWRRHRPDSGARRVSRAPASPGDARPLLGSQCGRAGLSSRHGALMGPQASVEERHGGGLLA